MPCPHCNRTLTEQESSRPRCPYCGRRLPASGPGVVRTASVLVASGEREEMYRSLDEVPPEVRRQLQDAINGPHSETFVIADERGREQVFKIITGLPPHLQKRILGALRFPEPAFPLLTRKAKIILSVTGLSGLAVFLWWIWRVV